MPCQDLMDVRVLVDGKPLQEYLDPDGPADTSHQQTRYIEVKAGQKFSLEVTLLPGFEFYNGRGVFANLRVDNGEWKGRYVKSSLARGSREKLLHPRCIGFTQQLCKDEDTGLWHMYDRVFGAFGTNDETTVPAHLENCDVDSLGTIRVTVFRLRWESDLSPKDWKIPETVDELPEKMLKGKQLKNMVKFERGAQCDPPAPIVHLAVPVRGVHGQEHEFIFKYRNRKILQNIGCIPRTPSPGPDAESSLMPGQTSNPDAVVTRVSRKERRERNLRMIKQEESQHELQKETLPPPLSADPMSGLILPNMKSEVDAEQDGNEDNVKKGQDNASTDGLDPSKREDEDGTVSQDSFVLIPAKRPREEDEDGDDDDDDDELVEVAPPPRKRLVIVDLTDE
ncbi:hypothetical protein A1O1_08472 [Capronia coronata CBS 617.96]|uniref:DUF7918 domain-containing protein n=1 Tax=Capronia coronata CBS 617.96 TaxID=1182541 RepID=W9XJH1_9EURO|nr:uncharacterized protein A1O1_08472 [Capronia coronata CBS 617.96]EXJ80328.1 hypothetical protein A1O1_08472 [Capronia coronata CBS 617.96]